MSTPKVPRVSSTNPPARLVSNAETLQSLFGSVSVQINSLRAFAEDLKRATVTELQASSVRLRRLLDNLDAATIDIRALLEMAQTAPPPVASPVVANSPELLKVDRQSIALHVAHETLLAVRMLCHADIATIIIPDDDTTDSASANYITIPAAPRVHPTLLAVGRVVDTQRTAVNITDRTPGAQFHSVVALPLRLPVRPMRRYGVLLLANFAEKGAVPFTAGDEAKVATAAECISHILGNYGNVSLKTVCPAVPDPTFAERWADTKTRSIAEDTMIFHSVKGVAVWLGSRRGAQDGGGPAQSFEMVKQADMMCDVAQELLVCRNTQKAATDQLKAAFQEISVAKSIAAQSQRDLMAAQDRIYETEKAHVLAHRDTTVPSQPSRSAGVGVCVRKIEPYLPKPVVMDTPTPAPPKMPPRKGGHTKPGGGWGSAGATNWNTNSVATRSYGHQMYLT